MQKETEIGSFLCFVQWRSGVNHFVIVPPGMPKSPRQQTNQLNQAKPKLIPNLIFGDLAACGHSRSPALDP